MFDGKSFTHKTIIPQLKEISKSKYGLISINYLLINCRMEDLLTFIKNYGISLPNETVLTRLEYIKIIALHLTNMYYISDIQNKYENPLEYVGYALLKEGMFSKYLINLDFIVKQDLIDTFADLYADLGVTVYNTSNDSITPKMDMYSVMKKSTLRTEAIFALTGFDMDDKTYLETKNLIEKTRSVANGSVFVTTPIGALKIGLNKLRHDMSKLNSQIYIVDPSRKIVYALIKSRKTEISDEELREKFVRKLSRTPMRAPSHVFKLSDYNYINTSSHDPNDFRLFDIYDDFEHNRLLLKQQEENTPKYAEVFRNLIIMEITSGTPIISYSSDTFKELTLASGFLAAIDSFVSKIGGSTMEEINYKGFYVQAAYGKITKLACFLSAPADKSLKERLKHLIELFEEKYEEKIKNFKISGNTNLFDDHEINYLIEEIIDV
ncbi:MAG: hypothetical protein ACTSV5_04385 [Promethearchaeota archaeon]